MMARHFTTRTIATLWATVSDHGTVLHQQDSTTVVESLLGEEGIHFTEEDTPCSAECVIEVRTPE